MEYLAHIADNGREQTLLEHSEAVRDLAAEFADAFGSGPIAGVAGYVHDAGKATKGAQERLHGGARVDHATAGAYELANHNWSPLWFCDEVMSCITIGHHGGIPDFGDPESKPSSHVNNRTALQRLAKVDDGLIQRCRQPDAVFPEHPERFFPSHITNNFDISMWLRMLYSCVVDADFKDTAEFMQEKRYAKHIGQSLDKLSATLEAYLSEMPAKNPVDLDRKEILRQCLTHANDGRGVFTFTAPPGGGKTLASTMFALKHAVANGMERIIYVIPYMTIIDQTVSVLSSIFGKRNVLAHYSDAVYDSEKPSSERKRRATEDWDASIVVTTSVQFFESMLSNKPSKCRKLHNIANSIVIFDEAQMLPPEHLIPCTAIIGRLVSDYRCSVVLSSATMPRINSYIQQAVADTKLPFTELSQDVGKLFDKFKRASIVYDKKLNTMERIAKKLAEQEQTLCVVNTKATAQTLFLQAKKETKKRIYHLSTSMCPKHRKKVLKRIARDLWTGNPCILVATSLVECGVDLDFKSAFREVFGLPSIQQIVGRVNRHGIRSIEESTLTVFPQIIRMSSANPQLNAISHILEYEEPLDSPETTKDYFDFYYGKCLDKAELDKYRVVELFNDGYCGRQLPFETVAERFHFIEDESRTVFIPYDKTATSLIEKIRSDPTKAAYRKLGQYGVNISGSMFDSLIKKEAIAMLDDENAYLTDMSLYSKDFGMALVANE